VQLIRAHITNFRSVEDSDEFEIEPDVTCLVGKNESGKTAALQALYGLSPVESIAKFDEDIQFPVRLTRRRLPAPTAPRDLRQLRHPQAPGRPRLAGQAPADQA
jgi:energy-coupling factor transporter ATP-binding protein EcfA2